MSNNFYWEKMFAPNPLLERLLKESVERVKNMSPEEREEMDKAQRKSWTEQDHD